MERPLSPFMFPTWYRFQITSALSILHRLTGVALAVGSILLVWWLITVAAGSELFAATHTFLASPIGLVLLFGWSVAFLLGTPATALNSGALLGAATLFWPRPCC